MCLLHVSVDAVALESKRRMAKERLNQQHAAARSLKEQFILIEYSVSILLTPMLMKNQVKFLIPQNISGASQQFSASSVFKKQPHCCFSVFLPFFIYPFIQFAAFYLSFYFNYS